jgi:hypothetical protein
MVLSVTRSVRNRRLQSETASEADVHDTEKSPKFQQAGDRAERSQKQVGFYVGINEQGLRALI